MRLTWIAALLAGLLTACGGGDSQTWPPAPVVPPEVRGPDPLLPQQWHLFNTGQSAGLPGMDLGLQGVTETGLGVLMAFVDGAVQIRHPDLVVNLHTVNGHLTFPDPSPALAPANAPLQRPRWGMGRCPWNRRGRHCRGARRQQHWGKRRGTPGPLHGLGRVVARTSGAGIGVGRGCGCRHREQQLGLFGPASWASQELPACRFHLARGTRTCFGSGSAGTWSHRGVRRRQWGQRRRQQPRRLCQPISV